MSEPDGVVLVVTRKPLAEVELDAIAEFLRTQTMPHWCWLLIAERAPESLRNDRRVIYSAEPRFIAMFERLWGYEAKLCLDRAVEGLDQLAIEQALWFFRSHLRVSRAGYQYVVGQPWRLSAHGINSVADCHWLRGRHVVGRWVVGNPGRQLLMVVPWLEPGGADRCNLDIARCLRSRGWTITILATLECEHRWAHRFRELGADVFIAPWFLAPQTLRGFLCHLLASRRPDLVLLSNSRAGYELLSRLDIGDVPAPWVALNHMEEAWSGGGFPAIAVRNDSLLARHWVVSSHLKQWMATRSVDVGKIDVLHWFVDSAIWRPCAVARAMGRQRFGVATDVPVILFAGRLCRQKRPDLFVDCMARLKRLGADFVVLVAGDGEMASHMELRFQKLGLSERVRMLGWLDDAGLRGAMQMADLFFLPSQAEGIALVLYEAMACGLPIVGARAGGQAELVGPGCGVLIDPDEFDQVQAYCEALTLLLGNRQALCKMGVNARRRIVDSFDRLHFENRLTELVGQALEEGGVATGTVRSSSECRTAAHLQWQWCCWRLLRAMRRGALGRVLLRAAPLPVILKGVLYLYSLGWQVAEVWRRRSRGSA